jgi:hypothetical protein
MPHTPLPPRRARTYCPTPRLLHNPKPLVFVFVPWVLAAALVLPLCDTLPPSAFAKPSSVLNIKKYKRQSPLAAAASRCRALHFMQC